MFKKVPQTLSDLAADYPKAFAYLVKKNPTSIIISDGRIILSFSDGFKTLAYGFQDIEFFQENYK